MEGIEHKIISANGLNIHIAEKGQGTLVLLIHGFPEFWYSWRHQILYLADHGYRAVAPDLCGYGDTTGAPVNDHTKFTIYHLVGDLIGLLNAITSEGEKVFVVGQVVKIGVHSPTGDIIQMVRAVYGEDHYMVRFQEPGDIEAELARIDVKTVVKNPTGDIIQMVRAVYGEDHYMVRFQEPGDIEAELARIDVKTVVKKFLTFREPGTFYFPKGKGFHSSPIDAPVTLPRLGCQKTMLSTLLVTSKNLALLELGTDRSMKWCKSDGAIKIHHWGSGLGISYAGIKDYIRNGGFQNDVPLLEEVVVLEDVAHFINQEKPDEINKNIIEFLKKF
ncbi:epoxide hydrolase [Artemisia annua]|uniref:Epoxide hydrolase n=1 Tax=Artemisia annua TaxID=35608 RepID=A0A2U1MGV6_ARTAN|nr:epoxide hydrolase [Artemisia annua]